MLEKIKKFSKNLHIKPIIYLCGLPINAIILSMLCVGMVALAHSGDGNEKIASKIIDENNETLCNVNLDNGIDDIETPLVVKNETFLTTSPLLGNRLHYVYNEANLETILDEEVPLEEKVEKETLVEEDIQKIEDEVEEVVEAVEPTEENKESKQESTEDNNSEYVYNISDADRLLFEQIVAAETGSKWTVDEKLTVASVVINRVNSKSFRYDTIQEVLTAPKQFSVYGSGRYLKVEITEADKEAVDLALRGKLNIDEDVVYFCTEKYYNSCKPDSWWKGLKEAFRVRNVVYFYGD